MATMILAIRYQYGCGKRIAFFADNAGINKTDLVKEAAARRGRGLAYCRLIYNQPYRPDLSDYLGTIYTNLSFFI